MKIMRNTENASKHPFEETCERDGASTRKISAEIYPYSSKGCFEAFSFFVITL
jgi:hypothetical protein